MSHWLNRFDRIAGIKLCESYNRQYGTDYRSLMPTNLYGPGDNFDLQQAHVIPALIHRFHQARVERRPSVTVWGSGRPRREFLHVDDLADACLTTMKTAREDWESNVDARCSHVNVGWGEDVSIQDLATRIARVTEFRGEIVFDTDKPDGTPRKLLDISRIRRLGWKPEIPLDEGLRITYRWFRDHLTDIRGGE